LRAIAVEEISMGVERLGHVQVRVTDLDASCAYYTNVLGLKEVERDGDRAYLKAWDEHDHHSLILRRAATPGLDHMAWKLETAADLEQIETRAERAGAHVERLPPGTQSGMGPAIRFGSPSGHDVVLFFGMEKVGNGLPKLNPMPRPAGLIGIAPPRLDHMLVTTEHVPESAQFFKDVMGFRLVEQVTTDDGVQLCAFMERSRTPHDIAFVPGNDGGLHHFAYWLDNFSDLAGAADLLRMNNVNIDIGPTRHGISRGHTIYFFDPDGNRNEVFTGGYYVDSDFEPITWSADQLGPAIFYYEGKLNERFLSVYS
jgi:catechol 2,3-dioxygenase